jgi:hypothetical protein
MHLFSLRVLPVMCIVYIRAKESVTSAFNAMRLIVLVGWAIYPLGYVFGLMMGSVDADTLNWIYNLADY